MFSFLFCQERSSQKAGLQDQILHVFSCRLYSLRKYRKAIDEDKDLREEKE